MKSARVVEVPPVVYEPAAHTLQVPLCPLLYLVSAPHGRFELVPSHSYPGAVAEQLVQSVRVVELPPVVYEPAAHTLQLLARLRADAPCTQPGPIAFCRACESGSVLTLYLGEGRSGSVQKRTHPAKT